MDFLFLAIDGYLRIHLYYLILLLFVMINICEEKRQEIWQCVKSIYIVQGGKVMVDEGLDLLEKLLLCNINQPTEEDIFSDVNAEVVLEIMKKLVKLINTNEDPKDLDFFGCYKALDVSEKLLGTYKQINKSSSLEADIKKYQVMQDEEKWNEKCTQAYGMWYVYAWQCSEKKKLEDYFEITWAKQSYFTVLIELCLKFREQIENQYLSELNNVFQPFICDCKKQLKEEMQVNGRSDFFAQNYTELLWGMEENAGLCWNDKNVIMYIGEAGAGKTTQMEKLYWDEINAEKENRLPIWIQVQNLKKDLLEEIKDRLQNHRGFCAELLKEGLITLYLDGLNELLVDDRGESVKNLVLAIKKLINSNPKLRVCMTDRTSNRIYQLVKDEKVVVFKCRSMNPALVEKYSKNQWGEAVAESITKAVDPKEESNKWFWADEEFLVVPEKVNGLKAMIDKKRPPKSKQEYYNFYFKHILKREKDEKGDNRVDTLKMLLSDLAEKMKYETDAKHKKKIIKLFSKGLGNDYRIAYEYFQLACQLPLIVECEKEEYKFAYGGYYDCLNDKKSKSFESELVRKNGKRRRTQIKKLDKQ